MFFLGCYEEFAPDMGLASIKENLQKEPYKTKSEILRYLKAGKVHMVTAARITDAVTCEMTTIPIVYMNDGEYSWNTKLIYYIEKHNLRLPQDVEEYILGKLAVFS